MKLIEALKGIAYRTRDDISGVEINGVVCDSRKVRPGGLFIAVKGHATDGYKFIGEAVSKGAGAVLAENDFAPAAGVKKVIVRDASAALHVIGANFYGHPAGRLKIAAVTGTNGKTTITYLIENILKSARSATGVIGTINYRYKDKVMPSANTTPGPLELQSLLSEMAGSGVRYVVMEVSSHSLDQGRVDGLVFDAAIFTNITAEHLDYHKTMKNYLAAKARIFAYLKAGGVAILNADDKRVIALKRKIRNKVMTYGIAADADVTARQTDISISRSSFLLSTPEGPVRIKSALIGRHNISNILAASACGLALGLGLDDIKKGVEASWHIPGRLQTVDGGQSFRVFVDYAHTEDALSNVLSLLRGVAGNSRIITVFGCGGNRDRRKRPLMGVTACRLSDRVVVTSDNPRFEDPARIIGEIEAGVKRRFRNYTVVGERRKAIEKAISLASGNDIVLIAGKGHEKYQIIKDKSIPFDDCEAALSALRKTAR